MYVDHQNSRAANWNTFCTYFYDFMLQEMSTLFTVHSLYEDELSVWLSFKLFDEILQRNNLPVS